MGRFGQSAVWTDLCIVDFVLFHIRVKLRELFVTEKIKKKKKKEKNVLLPWKHNIKDQLQKKKFFGDVTFQKLLSEDYFCTYMWRNKVLVLNKDSILYKSMLGDGRSTEKLPCTSPIPDIPWNATH